jgi:hypothetical protein
MILSGWKQIAQYMLRSVRTVQRWEPYGLSVRRPVPGRRSHVTAQSADIDAWLRSGRLRQMIDVDLIATIATAKKLCDEAQRSRENMLLNVEALRKQIAILRAKRQSKNSG